MVPSSIFVDFHLRTQLIILWLTNGKVLTWYNSDSDLVLSYIFKTPYSTTLSVLPSPVSAKQRHNQKFV